MFFEIITLYSIQYPQVIVIGVSVLIAALLGVTCALQLFLLALCVYWDPVQEVSWT